MELWDNLNALTQIVGSIIGFILLFVVFWVVVAAGPGCIIAWIINKMTGKEYDSDNKLGLSIMFWVALVLFFCVCDIAINMMS